MGVGKDDILFLFLFCEDNVFWIYIEYYRKMFYILLEIIILDYYLSCGVRKVVIIFVFLFVDFRFYGDIYN